MKSHFRGGEAALKSGEMYVIPQSIEHATSAENERQIMLVETAGTIKTGNVGGARTAADGTWI